jgi:hypothetical protein
MATEVDSKGLIQKTLQKEMAAGECEMSVLMSMGIGSISTLDMANTTVY